MLVHLQTARTAAISTSNFVLCGLFALSELHRVPALSKKLVLIVSPPASSPGMGDVLELQPAQPTCSPLVVGRCAGCWGAGCSDMKEMQEGEPSPSVQSDTVPECARQRVARLSRLCCTSRHVHAGIPTWTCKLTCVLYTTPTRQLPAKQYFISYKHEPYRYGAGPPHADRAHSRVADCDSGQWTRPVGPWSAPYRHNASRPRAIRIRHSHRITGLGRPPRKQI